MCWRSPGRSAARLPGARRTVEAELGRPAALWVVDPVGEPAAPVEAARAAAFGADDGVREAIGRFGVLELVPGHPFSVRAVAPLGTGLLADIRPQLVRRAAWRPSNVTVCAGAAYNKYMRFAKRMALVPAALVLAAAGLGGTAGHSASGHSGDAGRYERPRGSYRFAPAATCSATSSRRRRRSSGPGASAVVVHHSGRTAPGRRRPGGRRDTGRSGADGGCRLLRHQRPGAGRRRAGSRQDERHDAVRRRGRAAQRRRRHRDAPAAARLAEARRRLEPRAPARRRPAARALSRWVLADRPSRRGGDRDAVLPGKLGALGDRRLEPEGVAARPDADAGRRLRRRAPRRHDRAHRRLIAGADGAAVQAAGRVDGRGARNGAGPQPGVVRSSGLSSWLPTYRIKRAGRPAQAARPLVQCRNVDRPRGFSGLGMLTVLTVDLAKGLDAGRLDRRDDRRADRLRLPGQPVPGHRALDRPAAHGDADEPAAERHDGHPPLRHLRPDPHAIPRQRPGVGLPAEPVVAVRVRRRPARRQHGRARVVRLERFDRVVADDAAPRRRRAQPDRPRRQPRQGPTRLRGSLRRPDRVRRHVQAGRPPVHRRPRRPGAAARARRARAPRLLGVPAPDRRRTCCSGSARTSTTRAAWPARSCRSSTSPTSGTRRSSPTRRSARAGPRRSPITMPSSSGRARASSSCRSWSVRWASMSGGTLGIEAVGRITQPAGTAAGAAIRRAVVVGDSVFTVSDAGVTSSSLATLAAQGFAPFPAQAPVPVPMPG